MGDVYDAAPPEWGRRPPIPTTIEELFDHNFVYRAFDGRELFSLLKDMANRIKELEDRVERQELGFGV